MPKNPHSKSGGTPALALLATSGVAYRVHYFEHDPRQTDYGREAASALLAEAETVFKTLVWEVDGTPCVALAPVTSTVASKKLAKALGGRRAELAASARAERLTGSVVGAISPIALKTPMSVVLDDSALSNERMYVSAGRRGWEIEISPLDLVQLTSARVAQIIPDR